MGFRAFEPVPGGLCQTVNSNVSMQNPGRYRSAADDFPGSRRADAADLLVFGLATVSSIRYNVIAELNRRKDKRVNCMPNKTYLYKEVYNRLKNEILGGTYKAKQKIPNEEELCSAFHASKITIRKALDLLKEDGLIRRVQGHGSFVCDFEKTLTASVQERKDHKLIGIVLEHVSSSFGLEMVYHLMRIFDKEGYKTCIRFSFGSIEKETEEIDSLVAMGIDGLIIMPCHDSQFNMSILKLLVSDFPIVLIDKRMSGLPIHSVCTDGKGAIRSLIHHLRERGCSNTVLLTINPAATSSLGDRAEGYYTGLEETGLVSLGELILPRRRSNMISSEPEVPYINKICEYIGSLNRLPDSFVCTEYAIARALYHASKQLGYKPGIDFKACCIDETELSTCGIYFTCMRQDEKMLAYHTSKALLTLLRGKHVLSRDIRVPAVFQQGRTT